MTVPGPSCCTTPEVATDRQEYGRAEGLDAAGLATIFKALGDPVRLTMARMIAAAPEVCVCELTPAFDLSSGTISHHLKTLREAGIVECERRGTFVYYWLRAGVLEQVSAFLTREMAPAPTT